MKKTISIVLVALLLAVALVTVVACDPETPQIPDNGGNNNNNNNNDNDNDNGNNDVTPVIDYEVTAEEWNTIFSLQNASNFKCVCSFTLPSDAEFADRGEYILSFDGTTYSYQNKYYLNDETTLDSSILLTKKGDTYLSYSEGVVEEITKENYDEIFSEFPPTSMCYGALDNFTFNPATNMYELNDDVAIDQVSDFKVLFENGKVMKVEFTIDGEPWSCVFTYGETATIVFPENN
ncbi:MAG: hypothetical protein IKD35_03050 [Clostridia bacterium]|nr:hypothetical protein [Clostridia bacterium]